MLFRSERLPSVFFFTWLPSCFLRRESWLVYTQTQRRNDSGGKENGGMIRSNRRKARHNITARHADAPQRCISRELSVRRDSAQHRQSRRKSQSSSTPFHSPVERVPCSSALPRALALDPRPSTPVHCNTPEILRHMLLEKQKRNPPPAAQRRYDAGRTAADSSPPPLLTCHLTLRSFVGFAQISPRSWIGFLICFLD